MAAIRGPNPHPENEKTINEKWICYDSNLRFYYENYEWRNCVGSGEQPEAKLKSNTEEKRGSKNADPTGLVFEISKYVVQYTKSFEYPNVCILHKIQMLQ